MKRWLSFLFASLIWFLLPFPAWAAVLTAAVEGEISDASAYHVRDVLNHAKEGGMEAVVLSINTPGGDAAAAIRIRDAVMASPVPVVTYVNPRAWSAGALITLSGQKIYMAPGSSIGAAEPIPATEKTISAIKSEFQTTAKARGRNMDAAGAMVDKTMGFAPYAEKGQILSLTADEAEMIHLSDGTAATVKEAAAAAGYDSELVQYDEGMAAKALRVLRHPAAEAVLAAVIFLSIMAEIKTAGFSGGGLVAALAGILLIGSRWYGGDRQMAEIILYFGGMALIFADLLFLATGAAAAAGLAAMAAGMYFSFGADAAALSAVAAGLVLAFGGFFFLARYLSESRLWKKVSLSTKLTSDKGYVSSSQDFSSYVGKTGIARTVLRPAGRVLVDGVLLDVTAEGDFIEAGTPVVVIKAEGSRLVVRALPHST